uniref:uncharacterized protein LOC120341538 n=1 Tax=Styela clava TaxID=7725 RepID=UPI00193A755E|nr:uncharacterized protein LOC120341538 [Styela clava]
MNSSTLLLLLTLSSTFLSIASQRCRLPNVRMELDVKKLSKLSWYTGLETNDITSIISCIKYENFTSTKSGFRTVLTERVIRYINFGIQYDYDENGIYHLRESDREMDHAQHIRGMNGLEDQALLDMDHLIATGNYVYLTDYKNYFAGFLCPSDGTSHDDQQIIWGCFPSPNPTLSQVAAFINVLQEVGIFANFHASTCSETDWSRDVLIEK